MPNLDTIKAVEDNLSALITAQGFQLENSSQDPGLAGKPACALRMDGEDFGSSNGERPDYNSIGYTLRLSLSDKHPATTRDKAADWCHRLRSAVTAAALNTGALAASKLVTRVDHEGYGVVSYEPPFTRLEYRLRVRYRET